MVLSDSQIQRLAEGNYPAIALYCSVVQLFDQQFRVSGNLAKVLPYEVGVNVDLGAGTAYVRPSLPMVDMQIPHVTEDVMREAIEDLRGLVLHGRKYVVRGDSTSFWVSPLPIPTDARPAIATESA